MRILHTGDLHLGNHKAKAGIVYNNFKTYVYPLLANIDMLVIAGDIVDRGLAYDSDASRLTTNFLMELCTLVKQHKFLLRIVRGTWSHDRDSIMVMHKIALSKGVGDSVKYFDVIEIEYIKKFKKHFMYIPDDMPFTDLESRVINKIKDTSNGKIDVMVFHGMMKHVLPYMPTEPVNTINADNWFKYINDVCCCGHIHQKSIYRNKFIYSGSFDRMCHGDEGLKGFYLIDLKENKSPKVEFVENLDAHVFKSININDKSISDGITLITKTIAKYVEARKSPNIPVYIRVLVDDNITKAGVLNYTSTQYKSNSNVRISYKSEKIDIFVEEEEIEDEDEILNLTPDTLPIIISERIGGKLSVEQVSNILNMS